MAAACGEHSLQPPGMGGSTRTPPNDDSVPLESSAQDGTGGAPATPGTAGSTDA